MAVLCFFCTKMISQVNLIPNPSFEDSTGIPNNWFEINKCIGWYPVLITTPDYFSIYSSPTPTANNVSIPKNIVGYQNAKHGNFYIGMIIKGRNTFTNTPALNYFEPVQTKMPAPLLKDHIYDFTMFYSLADGVGMASNQLQAYFTVNQFSYNPNGPLTPGFTFTNNLNFQVENDTTQFMTDTMNWVPINGCFISQGGEEYLSIGNFRDGVYSKLLNVNRNTSFLAPSGENFDDFAYYYIDDLSLYDRGYYSGAAVCANDSEVCFNSATIIGNNIADASTYSWSPSAALSCTNCPNPVANPTVTTKYYLTKTLCSFITKDSIILTVFTPSINAMAGSSKTLCINEFTQLGINDSTKFTTYIWQPSSYLTCTNCAIPFTTPSISTTYTLQKSECNINSTSTVQITIQDCETTFTVPNIFTPNNDGVNETWGVKFNQVRDVKEFSMNIYNRWGMPILQTDLPNLRWDGYTTSGIQCGNGVYFFVCTFKVNDEPKTLKNNITLIR